MADMGGLSFNDIGSNKKRRSLGIFALDLEKGIVLKGKGIHFWASQGKEEKWIFSISRIRGGKIGRKNQSGSARRKRGRWRRRRRLLPFWERRGVGDSIYKSGGKERERKAKDGHGFIDCYKERGKSQSSLTALCETQGGKGKSEE